MSLPYAYQSGSQEFRQPEPQAAVGEEEAPRGQPPVTREGVQGLDNGVRTTSPTVPLLALEWENKGHSMPDVRGEVGLDEDDGDLLSLVDEPGVMHLINQLFPNV